jgi:glycosyltransferase involved in cell wall biosynthesis
MKRDKNQIVFIGPISPPVTGPGVKNKELIDSFKRHQVEIFEINSLGWTKNFMKFFYDVTKNSIKYKHVILSISKKGRFILMPLMYILKVIFGIRYILLPAGGNLDKEIINAIPFYKGFFKKALKNSTKIYVESKSLCKGIKNLNIDNVEYMPNPRRKLQYEWIENQNKERNIIFLSKIKAEKGVVVLINAAKELNKKDNSLKFDFYGPIDPGFKEEFEELVNKYNFVTYKGISDPGDVQETLSKADIFVFPTMWKNEGLPGVLVEASFTGVPMIISRFRASEEFIQNEINGIVVEPGSVDGLVKNINRLLKDKDLAKKISYNFKILSLEFDVDNHVKTILNDMKKNKWEI